MGFKKLKYAFLFVVLLVINFEGDAQIPLFYFVPTTVQLKYGFLPGVKFPIYPTISKYDLKGKKINPIYRDERYLFSKSSCSPWNFQKDSEFEGLYGLILFKTYFDSLLVNSNAIIDTTNGELIIVSLQVLQPLLFGRGHITVHGLCQLKVQFNEDAVIYCADIKDGDPNSPLSSDAFVTRKTAYRKMTSASMREAIEKYLIDAAK